MYVINARNVNDAFTLGMQALAADGVDRTSRYGDVQEYPEPVCTVFRRPLERVLFDGVRDANPFFHLMESLWMLAGRKDVAWVSQFSRKMAEFSDDGLYFHGAYGWRWRNHFGFDQLQLCIAALRNNPDDRRVVLQMWNPRVDLGKPVKDVPCNTAVYFKVRDGKLNMLVTNRSNDAIWGCYGANAVHMSVLMEYVAAAVGVQVGTYRQMSDSLHAYKATWPQAEGVLVGLSPCLYEVGAVQPFPLVESHETFDADLERFMVQGEHGSYTEPFFTRVAVPSLLAWRQWKVKDVSAALEQCQHIAADDWRVAMTAWLNRRMK